MRPIKVKTYAGKAKDSYPTEIRRPYGTFDDMFVITYKDGIWPRSHTLTDYFRAIMRIACDGKPRL